MDLTLDIKPVLDLNLENKSNNFDVVIIGGGPAGATAAIYTARADLKTLVIDKGLTAGALGLTAKIANYPGVPGEISGAGLLENMREQARSFGAEFTQDKVQAIDLLSDLKTVYGNNGAYTGRAVIIATGSMGRGQRVKGEDRLLGRGVSYCATCDAAFFRGLEVAVAGCSDEALEEALFLTKFASKVHLFSSAPKLKAPEYLIHEVHENPTIELYLGATLKEVIGEEKVEAVLIGRRGQGEQVIPVAGAFIYLQGGKPVTDFLQGQLDLHSSGCLVVDREHQTGLPGVYAVGDVLCDHIKQAVVAAAEGAVAGMAVEKQLHGRKQIAVDWSK
jgi:thioredoxin reductase (NADPH)